MIFPSCLFLSLVVFEKKRVTIDFLNLFSFVFLYFLFSESLKFWTALLISPFLSCLSLGFSRWFTWRTAQPKIYSTCRSSWSILCEIFTSFVACIGRQDWVEQFLTGIHRSLWCCCFDSWGWDAYPYKSFRPFPCPFCRLPYVVCKLFLVLIFWLVFIVLNDHRKHVLHQLPSNRVQDLTREFLLNVKFVDWWIDFWFSLIWLN